MKKYKRIFTIVIDSLGIGAMPNAAEYDDEGTDTLGHIDDHMQDYARAGHERHPHTDQQLQRNLAEPFVPPGPSMSRQRQHQAQKSHESHA